MTTEETLDAMAEKYDNSLFPVVADAARHEAAELRRAQDPPKAEITVADTVTNQQPDRLETPGAGCNRPHTVEFLRGAIAALEGHADSFLPILAAEEDWAYEQAHISAERFKAQLAAMESKPTADPWAALEIAERALERCLGQLRYPSGDSCKNLKAFKQAQGEINNAYLLAKNALAAIKAAREGR